MKVFQRFLGLIQFFRADLEYLIKILICTHSPLNKYVFFKQCLPYSDSYDLESPVGRPSPKSKVGFQIATTLDNVEL